MKLSPEDANWFAQVQGEWMRRVKPHQEPLGRHVFDVPPKLEQSAVEGATLYADRVEAMKSLPRGGCVAEVGTQTGWFAERIVDHLRPRELHLFDLSFDLLDAQRPALRARPEVVIHHGDSSQQLALLPDGHFDWIYVDGDHGLEGVKRDAAVAVHKIKRDGILVFNDYTPWSIMELADYGVMPVVNGLLASGEWQVRYLALHPHMYCDIAIARRQR